MRLLGPLGDRTGSPPLRGRRRPAPRPGVAGPGTTRRARRVRRASAGLTRVRAAALAVLVAAVLATYAASTSDALAARRTEVSGTLWTPAAAVVGALRVTAGQNLFTLETRPLEARIAGLPAVLSATVTVALPDELRVAVTERRALVAWSVGARRFLVDERGSLFGDVPSVMPPGAPALPVVDDRRPASASLAVGSVLDPVDLDAALRLGALTPADVGSAATRLAVRLDDDQGFTVGGEPTGWTAVFGFYTPTLRTTDLIPGQVRLLRSLLGDRERSVLRVILADERTGTYVPRPSPSPTATPRPTPRARASSTTAP